MTVETGRKVGVIHNSLKPGNLPEKRIVLLLQDWTWGPLSRALALHHVRAVCAVLALHPSVLRGGIVNVISLASNLPIGLSLRMLFYLLLIQKIFNPMCQVLCKAISRRWWQDMNSMLLNAAGIHCCQVQRTHQEVIGGTDTPKGPVMLRSTNVVQTLQTLLSAARCWLAGTSKSCHMVCRRLFFNLYLHRSNATCK